MVELFLNYEGNQQRVKPLEELGNLSSKTAIRFFPKSWDLCPMNGWLFSDSESSQTNA